MTATFESLTISVCINQPADIVYNFVSVPENFPKWASGLSKSMTKVNGEWLVETPQGPMKVRFTARNKFGVLDHYVIPESGPEIYIPLRVIANGAGSELIFTLFRLPGMTDEKFNRGCRLGEARPQGPEGFDGSVVSAVVNLDIQTIY